MQGAVESIMVVNVGDLEFSSSGWLQAIDYVKHIGREHINARNTIVTLWVGGLFVYTNNLTILEFGYAVPLRIWDTVEDHPGSNDLP